MNRPSHIKALQKVYHYLAKGYPTALKDVCNATGLSYPTVRNCRDELIIKGYLKVHHFNGNNVCYTPTVANVVTVFGEVTSIVDQAFTFKVNVKGDNFDFEGDPVDQFWELNLDLNIMKAIADYMNKLDNDLPLF